jgi:hypothetical protein
MQSDWEHGARVGGKYPVSPDLIKKKEKEPEELKV